jgi:hypothetical protein
VVGDDLVRGGPLGFPLEVASISKSSFRPVAVLFGFRFFRTQEGDDGQRRQRERRQRQRRQRERRQRQRRQMGRITRCEVVVHEKGKEGRRREKSRIKSPSLTQSPSAANQITVVDTITVGGESNHRRRQKSPSSRSRAVRARMQVVPRATPGEFQGQAGGEGMVIREG